jgi:hypothetical protein
MQLIFRPNHDKKTVKSNIWDIGKTTCVLGQETCKVIPVIHAISGCDTTSKLYGVGKRAALKKFMDSQTLKELGDVFMKIFQMEDIIKSGEELSQICMEVFLPKVSMFSGTSNSQAKLLQAKR